MNARVSWLPTANALDGLLLRLDPDRHQAAARYEALRRRLIGFFEWRGSAHPEEHADMTLDRLMRRLSEGEAIDRVESYAYGIARLVLLETARRERLLVHSANMDDVLADTEDAQSRIEGFGADEAESAKVDDELRMDALEACLEQLSPAERSLVLAYYAGGDGADRIEQRKVLSQRLGVAEHIVRARVFRVRARLERCMRCRERGDTSRCKQQTTDRGEPS